MYGMMSGYGGMPWGGGSMQMSPWGGQFGGMRMQHSGGFGGMPWGGMQNQFGMRASPWGGGMGMQRQPWGGQQRGLLGNPRQSGPMSMQPGNNMSMQPAMPGGMSVSGPNGAAQLTGSGPMDPGRQWQSAPAIGNSGGGMNMTPQSALQANRGMETAPIGAPAPMTMQPSNNMMETAPVGAPAPGGPMGNMAMQPATNMPFRNFGMNMARRY